MNLKHLMSSDRRIKNLAKKISFNLPQRLVLEHDHLALLAEQLGQHAGDALELLQLEHVPLELVIVLRRCCNDTEQKKKKHRLVQRPNPTSTRSILTFRVKLQPLGDGLEQVRIGRNQCTVGRKVGVRGDQRAWNLHRGCMM